MYRKKKFYEIFPQTKVLLYVATLFRLVARFANVGIHNSRPDRTLEVLVSVSDSFLAIFL